MANGGVQQAMQAGGFSPLSQFPGKLFDIPIMGPEQSGTLNQLRNLSMGRLQNLLGGGDFAPIAARAHHQFMGDTIPGIANYFTSMDGQRSGAFQQALGGAAASLHRDLAAQEQAFNLQQQQGLLPFLELGLSQQSQPYFEEAAPTFGETFKSSLGQSLGNFLPQLIPIALSILGAAVGGPFGAAVGGGLGALGSGAFGGGGNQQPAQPAGRKLSPLQGSFGRRNQFYQTPSTV